MRSALSSCVGGVPGGTMMVGATPVLPAGERSCVGMGAIVDDPAAGPLEVVVGPAWAATVVVVVGVAEEFVHAARPTVDAASATSGNK